MKLVIINGSAESGKDKFIEFIQFSTSGVVNFSTIDPVKEALRHLGWNGKKTDEDRKWMADTKKRWIQRYNGDGCVNWVENIYNENIYNAYYKLMFIHCREPEEIEKIVKRIPTAVTLLIRRPNSKVLKNGADDVVENYKYDYVIENDGDLEDLKNKAHEFMLKM